MSRSFARPSLRRGLSRWLTLIPIAAVSLFVFLIIAWTEFMLSVPRGKMAVLIKKTGLDLPPDEEVAPDDSYKGVQKKVLTEGRYFRNPLLWDWELVDQQEVPAGKVGLLIRRAGKDLPYGEFLAPSEEYKGIVPEPLKPGRYQFNPYVETIDATHEPRIVPLGFQGVVTDLAGPMPEDPNVLLVPDGFRGVQATTLKPGTYYINPYSQRVDLVDCRTQRFNLAQNQDMGFPSKDGFWVQLDGVIQFRVKPEKAAEVFVIYNESHRGEHIDNDIIRKVILPNARSFCRLEGSNILGREFISGTAREHFQANFTKVLQAACEPLGILVEQVLITRVTPPEQIAKPVRDREIAKQQEKQYLQQMLQQESESKLAIERETVKQKSALVQAQQEVVVLTTAAEQQQEVDVTKAQERLGVADFKLKAAQDEAAAIEFAGEAAAKVQQLNNEAEAAGWQRSVEAFGGDGTAYAQFVLYEKMATAYRDIMVNTADSPIMKIFDAFATPRGGAPLQRAAQSSGSSSSGEGAPVRPTSASSP